MDRGSLLPFQLWCPRPFGTYSQNQPRPLAAALKPAAPEPGSGAEADHGPVHSENTPPALAPEAPAPQPAAPLLSAATAGDEGRVLLDTWYVIKPGNTKEKVAFFVAHQCGGGSRASSMKVKGHWGSDSSKAKRRRRCLEPTKAPPDPGGREGLPAVDGTPGSTGEDLDLLSVAEMVALVEQRAALALQNYPRPGTPAPVVFVSAEQGGPAKGLAPDQRRGAGGAGDCSRVAEAVAHFEAQRDSPPAKGLRKEERPGPGPGEVRIAFRISNGREPRAQDGGLPTACRLYRHVSHDFLEIRFKIQRLLEPRQYMLLLPEHVLVKIFSFLPTRALAALKCTCHHFQGIIEAFGVRATDSRWSRDPLYRDDPCKQCRKRYEKGDVSLCRWHPKPYHHDLPYGRSYWMCCRRADRETPGCRLGLHDNNWVLPCHGPGGGRAGGREEGR
ncbi:F-box only protein 46 [Echinops telfairi]|uniref:F-box only protein 46 n=1 Tax=Echinops telfairi TaxID=9371 RepID=A0ABM0IYB4_ECHTE|nr:F-box only protein 46 [Echinops telfairi]